MGGWFQPTAGLMNGYLNKTLVMLKLCKINNNLKALKILLFILMVMFQYAINLKLQFSDSLSFIFFDEKLKTW